MNAIVGILVAFTFLFSLSVGIGLLQAYRRPDEGQGLFNIKRKWGVLFSVIPILLVYMLLVYLIGLFWRW
jgi:hypothetical protein